VSAPFMSTPRKRSPRRRVAALGREYLEVAYTPKFALGIVCSGQADQQRCYRRLLRLMPGKEIKVLVI